MTEQEWLTSDDPQAMLTRIGNRPCEGTDGEGRAYAITVSDRKLRLFACACVRQVWDRLTDPRSRQAVEVAERFADGEVEAEEMTIVREAANAAARAVDWAAARAVDWAAAWAAAWAAGSARSAWYAAWDAARSARDAAWTAAWAVHAALIRDIAGNPWRPVTLNPAWLTPTVVSLAQAAYDERVAPCGRCGGSGTLLDIEDFDTDARTEESCDRCHGTGIIDDGTLDPVRLAILADALEEAGCDNEDLLAHLRSPGPHVRGCFVLDLILGRE